jgi:subtilase family serine protease
VTLTLNIISGKSIQNLCKEFSSVKVINSQIINVTPSLPKVSVKAPMSATGEVNVSITVRGEDVSQVMLYIDNTLLTTFSGNGTFVYTLNTANYPDGTCT